MTPRKITSAIPKLVPLALILAAGVLPRPCKADPQPKARLAFEPRGGAGRQAESFVLAGGEYAVELSTSGFSIAIPKQRSSAPPAISPRADWKKLFGAAAPERQTIRVRLTGAAAEARATGLDPLPERVNYLTSRDSKRWRRGVRRYQRVRYAEVYPGVNVEYYGEASRLEYDFIVSPHSDPSRIRLRFEGVDEAAVDESGAVVLRAGESRLRQLAPLAYQLEGARRTTVPARWTRHDDGSFGFELADYDNERALVIDPVVDWRYVAPGSEDDRFSAVAVDQFGFVYAVGTAASLDLPVVDGLQQQNAGGPQDAYLVKLSPGTGDIIFATYIGGSGRELGTGVAVDADGFIYVSGSTNSSDFPVTDGAFQTTFGGVVDAFVVQIAPDGSGITYATYVGGPGPETGSRVAVDGSGSAYLTGTTLDGSFPVTAGALQTQFGGQSDAFVSKLSPSGSSLDYSTFIGGSGQDSGSDIALDFHGRAVIAGATTSTNLAVTPDAYQSTLGGGTDAFVAALDAGGDGLSYASYLGGSGDDYAQGLDLDRFGRIWFVGGTDSTDLPVTPGAPNPNFLGGDSDGFIARLLLPDAPDFSELVQTLSSAPGVSQNVPDGPAVTYSGDSSTNSELGVSATQSNGNRTVVTSRSNLSQDGVSTGKLIARDPDTLEPKGDGVTDEHHDYEDLDGDDETGEMGGAGVAIGPGGSLDGAVIAISNDDLVETPSGADLILEKTVDLGNPVRFFVVVTNAGPDTARNVQIADLVPAAYQSIVVISETKCFTTEPSGNTSGKVRCTLGDLPRGESRTVQIDSFKLPEPPGQFVNRAAAAADNLIGGMRLATAEFSIEKLGISKIDIQKKVTKRDLNTLNYQIVVKNTSSDRQTGIEVEDTFEGSYTFLGASPDKGSCDVRRASPFAPTQKTVMRCKLASLAPNETWTINVTGRPPAMRAALHNFASATSAEGSRDVAYEPVYIADGPAAADLSLKAHFGPDIIASSGICRTLTAAVFNRGPDSVSSYTVQYEPPSSVDLVEPLCGGPWTCPRGALAVGSTDTFPLLRACSYGKRAAARFQGRVAANLPDPDQTNNYYVEMFETGKRTTVKGEIFITNSADGKLGVVTAGSDPAMYGTGFTDQTLVADSLPLPTVLGGVTVELNGIPAPLVFVSPNQVNFQTPIELATTREALAVARVNGVAVATTKLFVEPVNPGIFTTNGSGSGQGTILIAGTASLAAPAGSFPNARPVKRGSEYLSIYCNGLGWVNDPPRSGDGAPLDRLVTTANQPQVTIGGVEANVLFSGLAPGFAGLYQVNTDVPAGVAPGDAVNLTITIGGIPSNTVTIAVAGP